MRKLLLFFLGSILSTSLFAQEVLTQTHFGIQKDSVIEYFKNWNSQDFFAASREYWTWRDWQKAESQVHIVWDHTSQSWKPNKNIHFTYHGGHGKQAASFSHTWDKATGRWWKTQRDTTIFHDSGRELEVYTHKLTMGSSFWKNRKKEVYQYESEHVYKLYTYDWDLVSNKWKEFTMMEISEKPSGKIDYYRAYFWDEQSRDWYFIGRGSYSYDKEGRLLEEKIYDEKDLKMRRYQSSYNEAGLLDEIIEYGGFPGGMQWTESRRYSFKYDTNGKLYQEDREYKDPTSQAWVLHSYLLIYGKSHQEALAEEAESIPLTCNFPNPYTSQTPFNCTEMLSGKEYQLELIDLAGRKVEEQNLIGDEIISLKAEVPQGLYLLMIKDQSQVLTAERIYIQQP